MLKTSNDQRKLLPNFEQLFTTTAQAPGGVARLRELILTLAVQGKLVPQDASDEPASALLKKIRAEKDRLMAEGKIKKDKPLAAITDEEKPFELPVGWEWVRLGDLVRVLNGRAYKKQELLDEGPVPVLRVGNLFTSNHWYYSDLELEEDKYCSAGELLYAWSASFGPFIWSGPKAIYHYHIWKLDPWSLKNFDHGYLHRLLLEKTSEIKASGHGISMAHMTKEKMERLVVAYPPLAEQTRIVARVEALMRLCDALEEKGRLEHTQHQQLLQAMLDSLTQTTDAAELARHWQRLAQHFDLLIDRPEAVDALEQTILQLAVRGLLVPRAAGDQPASDVLLGDIAELINGDRGSNYPNKEEYVEEGIPFINTGHIDPDGKLSDARMNKITRAKFNSLRSGKVRKNDLVYCLRGATLGKTAIVKYEEGAIASSLVIIRPSEKINKDFLYLFLVSPEGRKNIYLYDNGSAQPNLAANSVRKYKIKLPSLVEQSRIVARVTELRALCQQLREKLTQARRTQTQLAQAWEDKWLLEQSKKP